MHKRKICVVTGSRADYGLLQLLMKEIRGDARLQLQIIATGMHLSPEFGLTFKQIEEGGFHVDEKVEMLLSSDTPKGIAKSIGLGVIGFADAFERVKPDVVVFLGDRFEIFAAAQAAMAARIPIAHIHGGETTEGAIDEAMRHAITKMACFHFVAAEPYRRRVIQMGEDPDRVINVGAPGLDNLKRMRLLNRYALEKAIDFPLGKLSFLVTYHPVTLSKADPSVPMHELLVAIDSFPQARTIFTKTNADTYGRIINKMIDEYVAEHPEHTRAFTSLGQLRYLSTMKHVDAVIGNSSSGLLEAPALRKPTINIGDRQKGRLRASSVIDCVEKIEAIVSAVKKALSEPFQLSLKNVVSPYGQGNASLEIKEYLKRVDLGGVLMKQFHDIGNVL